MGTYSVCALKFAGTYQGICGQILRLPHATLGLQQQLHCLEGFHSRGLFYHDC